MFHGPNRNFRHPALFVSEWDEPTQIFHKDTETNAEKAPPYTPTEEKVKEGAHVEHKVEKNMMQREEDEYRMKAGKVGAAMLFKTFALNTTMLPIPNFARSQEKIRSIYWLLILLGGLSGLSYQMSQSITKYIAFGISTNLNTTITTSLEFPAVTICNANPVRKSKATGKIGDYLKKMEGGNSNPVQSGTNSSVVPTKLPNVVNGMSNSSNGVNLSNVTSNSSNTSSGGSSSNATSVTSGSSAGESSSNAAKVTTQPTALTTQKIVGRKRRAAPLNPNQGVGNTFSFVGADMANREMDSSISNSKYAQSLLMQEPLDSRMAMGYILKEMFISCTWNTYQCTADDFVPSWNLNYGNCYTFNVKNQSSGKRTRQIGPLYGLTMELLVNQLEYTSVFSPSVGVRVVIHPADVYPFPSDQGIDAGVGRSVSIALQKKAYFRKSAPYGKCVDYKDEDSAKLIDAFINRMPTTKYSPKSCLKTCYQQNVMKSCYCFDPSVAHEGPPFDSITTANGTIYSTDSPLGACNVTAGSTDDSCMTGVKVKFSDETDPLKCTASCPVRCYDEEWKAVVSSMTWPSTPKATAVGTAWVKMGMVSDSDPSTVYAYAQANVARVVIYYDTLNVAAEIEDAAYDLNALFSDFGGQMGLWLGLSIASLLEFIELMCDILVFSCRTVAFRCQKKKTPAVHPKGR